MELGRDVCIAKFAIRIWGEILVIDFLLQELTFLKVNFHKRSAKRKKNRLRRSKMMYAKKF